jgi:phage baseplate assembly protein gpV
MKKFMIFLLMVFLYLGTCQARSEAKHFNNAGTPLPSWVTSSSSHSYFMDVKAMDEVVVAITPTQPQSIGLGGTATSRTYAAAVTGLAAGENVTAYKWYVDGSLQQNDINTQFTVVGGNLPAGTHQIKCEVVTDLPSTYTSNTVILTVSEGVVVNIVGPDHACENAVVTFTAQVENDNIGATYQWRRDGQFIVGATNPTYSFAVNNSNLPGLSDTLTYEFDVQVNRAGCETQYSPVHYFSVSPKPVDTAFAELFCDASHTTTLTAYSFTSGTETPYMWKWVKGTDTIITYTNTVTLNNVNNGDKVVVFPIYQNYSCNPDSTVVTLQTYEDKLNVTGNLSIDVAADPAGPVCAGTLVKLKVTDSNTRLGKATYTWYKDGQLVNGVTDTVYSINMYDLGSHSFQVYAAYDSFPCQNPVANTTVEVEAAPTNVVISGANVICAGDSATLTAVATGAAEYAWDGGTFAAANTFKAAAGVHYVIAKSTNGCETMSAPFTVTEFGADLQITASATSICPNESVTLNADADGWTGDVTYEWTVNGSTVAGPTVNVTPTDANHKYTVTAKSGNCTKTDSIDITVNTVPSITNLVANPTEICQGETTTITVTGDAAYYIWYEDNQMVAGQAPSITVSPMAAGSHTYTVKGVSAQGCESAIYATPATVTVKAAPTGVVVTGNNVVCTGQTTMLVAAPYDANLSYEWIGGTSTKDSLENVGAGVYAVKVSNGNCSTTSAPFTVTEFGADLQVTGQNLTICKGESAVLNANVDGWTGNVTYKWSNNLGTNPTITVNPEITTTYTVTATNKNGAGDSCTAVQSIVVTVNQLPAKPTLTANSSAICAGEQVSLTATPLSTDSVYTWYMDGVEIPGENLSSLYINVNEAGTHHFAVRMTSPSGCASALSDEKTVVVNAAPQGVVVTGNNVVCEGQTTTLTAAPNVSTYTYEWIGGTSTTYQLPDVGAGVYAVKVSNGTCSTTSDPFTVTAFGADLQVSTTAYEICKGESVTLNANADGWTGNVTYSWSNSATTPTIHVAPTSTTTYTVTSTMNSIAACNRVDSIVVTVNDAPTAPTVDGNATICAGNLLTLTATAGSASYIWYMDGVQIPGENLNVLNVTLNTPGSHTFYAKAVSDKGCVSDASAVKNVTVEAAPTLVTITGDNVICEGDSVQLTVLAVGADKYAWSTAPATKVTTNTLKVPAGVYTVTAYSTNGCASVSAPFTVTAFGTDVQVVASETAICKGDHVTLNVNQNGWTGNVAYTWSEGNNHAPSIDVAPETTTTYTVTSTVTSTNGVQTTCQRVDSIRVIVFDLPEAPTATAAPKVICEGAQSVITANPTTHAAYIWYQDGVEIPGENQSILRVMPSVGVHTYSVKAVNTNNCVSANASKADTVTVEAAPTLVTITGDNVICENDSTILTVLAVGADKYAWSTAPTTKVADSTLKVPAGVYTVTAYSENGCASVSDPFTVNAFGADVQVTATATTVCSGEHVTLNANANGWVGNVTYKWDANANNSETVSVDVAPTQTTTYAVTSTVTSTSGTCSRTDSIKIYVLPIANAPVIAASADTICENSTVAINVTNHANGASYKWFMDGQELAGEGYQQLIVAPMPAGWHKFAAKTMGANGCVSDTLSNIDSVYVEAAPSLVAITGDNVICENDSTKLTVTAVGAVKYAWSTDPTTIAEADTLWVPAGIYTVTAYSQKGCASTSAPFEVNSFGADVQVTATATTICAAQHITLNANADGWTGNVTYKWDANADNATTPSVDVAPTQTTTYAVTSTVTSTSGTCERTDSIRIVVLPIANAPVIAANADTICENTTVVVNVTNHTTGASYKWFMDGQEIAGEGYQQLIVSPMPAGWHKFAAKTIGVNGCVSDTLSNIDSVYVEAAPSLVAITGDNIICENDSTKLTVTAVGAVKYAWSTAPATIAEADTLWVPAGIYTVTAYSQKGCASTSAPFEVNSFGVDIQVTATRTAICQGEHVTLNANADGWVGNVSYQWDANAGDATTPSVDVAPDTTTTFKVTSTVSSTSGTCERVDSIKIVVFELPTATNATIVGNDTICQGAQAVVSATPANHANYIWYQNGIEILGEHLATLTVMPDAPGMYTYNFKAINENGCVSDTVSTPDTLIVLANPTVQITGDPLICHDSTVTLYAFINDTLNTLANSHNYTYTWRLYNYTLQSGNNLIDGQTIEVSTIGNDTLKATLESQDHPYIFTAFTTNENGCVAESDPYYVYVGDTIHVAVTLDYDTVCQGGEVTATAHLGDYNMWPLIYQWHEIANGVDSVIPWGTERIYTTNVKANKTVLAVDVTNNNTGCTATGYSDSIVVMNPVVDAVVLTNGINGNDTTDVWVCEGATINVVAYLKDDAGNRYVDSTLRYVWKENGFLMPLVTGPYFTKQTWILDDDSTHYTYEVFVDYGMNGCTEVARTSNTVHVKRNPIVEISGVHHICYQDATTDNVHLTGWVDGVADTNAVYKWYRNGSLRSNDHAFANYYNENVPPTYNDPIVYKLEVINGDGCSAFSPEFVVNVHEAPEVHITASDTLICKGGDVMLNANLNNYNENMLTFQWYENQPNAAHKMLGYTHEHETIYNLQQSTTYYVEVIHLLNDETNENFVCASYDQVFVHVVDDPVIDSITTDLPDTMVLCDGRSVTMTAHVSGGIAGGEVFTWFRNGEIIPNATAAVFTETVHAENNYPTVYEYAVAVSQAGTGCESAVTFDTVKFTVYPNPTLAIETDPFVCQESNNNIMMVAHVDPAPATDYTFTWYEDNAVLADSAKGAHLDTMYLTRNYRDYAYNFSVSLVNAYGCQATAETQIYVDSVPVINITATETNICEGGVITLTANLNNWNTPNMQYQWFDTTSAIAGATSLSYTVAPSLGTHKYSFKALQLNSLCQATSNEIEVTVNADPKIDSVTTDLPASKTLCDGRSVTMTAHVSGGVTGGEVYTWYRNGEVIPNAVEATYTETPHALGDYTTTYIYEVSVKQTAAGCESTVKIADTVTVTPNPTLAIETDPFVCQATNNNIMMVAHVDPAPTTDYSFAWYEDNNLLADSAMGVHKDTLYLTRNYRDYVYNFNVVLVNDYGCQATAEAHIYVDSVPVINITATETNICVGGEITLTANLNNWNTPNMQYQWFDTTSAIAGATSLTYTVVPTQGTHKYTFKALQLNSLCNATSNEVTVTVNADPTIDSVTTDLPASKTLCDGRSVTMTAHVSGGVTGGEVYTWYRNGEVIPEAVGAVYTETPRAIGDFTTNYTYSVSVRQTAAGCESSVTFADTVKVTPNPTLAIETDPFVCQETSNNITMIAHVDPAPTTDFTFTWYEDNAPLTGATGVHKDTIVLTRNYRDYAYNFNIVLVNEYGCQATAETHVYVDTVPVINITATETNICEGGEITLTANLNNWNTPNMQYQWFDTTSAIAGATSLTYTVVPTQGTHKYTFKALQLNSLCNAMSNEVTVTVNADPTIDSVTTDLPASKTLCDGRSVTMTAHVSGGVTGGEVYTWYRNGEVIPNAVEATYTETPHALGNYPTNYTYSVSVRQTAAGCESSVTFADTLTVNPNPTLAIEADPIVCQETSNNITMIAHVDPAPTTDYTFTWYEDNAPLTGATGVHKDTIVLTRNYRDYAYNFSISLVNAYGCQATAETQIYVDTVPVINIVATETNICDGGEITLTANLNNWNTGNMQYQWFDNDTLIAGATSLTYTVVPAHGTHDYTFKALQLNSLCQAKSNTVTVNVIDDPIIATVTMSDTNVCEGAQITITAVPGNYTADNSDVYTWYRNGILIPGATGRIITDSPVTVDQNTQQFSYTAVVKRAAAGCESAPVSSAVLTVYRNPIVQITGDQHVCETSPIYLIANVDTTGRNVGILHYTWYESGQLRDNLGFNLGDNQFYSEYFYARTEPYRFTVNVEREGVPAACASMSSEYLVYVYPQPVVNITASETEICTDGEVVFMAHLNDPNARNMTYQWYEIRNRQEINAIGRNADGSYIYDTINTPYRYEIPGATSPIYRSNFATTTTVGVVVFQTNSTCSDNDEILITVNPRPEVTAVTVNNGQTSQTVCNGAQITVAATINPANAPGAVYTWYRDNELIPGATQSTYSENVFTTDNQITNHVYSAIVTLPMSGCVSLMSTNNATVTVKPAPATVSISGDNVLCENDSTVLTAYSDVPGSFTWSNGDTTNTTTVAAGIYTVTLTTPEGCEKTSDPFEVTAFGAEVQVVASETAICEGEHVTLYAHENGWTGNVTYTWENGSHASSIDVQPLVTTTFMVTSTVNSTSGSCSRVDSITVIVTPLPAKLTITTPADTICENQQYTLTANVTNLSGYIWYQNGVEIPGENQASLTVNFPAYGVYNFSVKGINDQGCVSAQASDPVAVTVTPAPSTVTISGNNVICENDSTVLYAYSDVPGTFTWNDGTTGATKTVAAGIYNVTLTTAEGCSMTSDNFEVTAFGSEVQVIASQTSICAGEHVTLYAHENGWTGNVSYTWDNGSHASSIDVQPLVTTTFMVTSTVNSTSGASGTCSRVDSIKVIVHELPVQLTVTTTTAVICQGDQAVLNATPATEAGYIWYLNGVEIPGENQSQLRVDMDHDGIYNFSAKAINTEGCISAVASAPATVTVTPAPTTVTISGNNVICENDSTVLTAYSDVTGTFTWSDGTVGATNTVTAGVYTVTMRTTEGCEKTSEPFTVTAFGSDVQVVASQTAICAGEHVTLYANETGWTGNVAYTWDNGSHASSIDVTPAVTTTYNVTSTVTSTSGTCQRVDNITIVVTPLPDTVHLTALTRTVICQNDQVTIHADGNAAGYIWYQNGVEIPGENQANLTVNFPDYGTYNFAAKAVNAEGCVSAVASDPLTVTVTKAPTTVTISGNNVICENDSTVLTAYSDVMGTFTWSDGTVGATNTVTAGVYTVTIETRQGCQLTSEPFTVTAFGSDVQVVASQTAICAGEHVTLYANETGWTGNVAYTWDNGSHASSIDVTPAVTTTYNVTSTVTSTSGTCQRVDNITIVVTPLPDTVHLTATTPTTICQNGQVTIHADGNAAGYIWYQNGVEIAGENQADLTVNFPDYGTYNFAAKAVNVEGCVSAVASEPLTVTVNKAPTTVTISGNNVICENDSTVLYAYSDVTGTFTWSDGTVGATNTVMAGVYTVTMRTAEGCEMTSDPFTVTAFGSDVQVVASQTAICAGEHVTLYANETGWTGNVAYTWENGSHASSIDVTPAVTTTYNVTSTVTSTSGTCQRVDNITVVVTPLPDTVHLTATAPTTICQNGQVTIHADGNAAGYIWYQNGVEIAGENQADLTVNFPDYGTYNFAAKAVNAEGCVSAVASDPLTVTVTKAPTTVTISGDNIICENDVTTLTAYSDVPGTFTWSNGTTGATNVVNAGTYTVTMRTAEGCEMTSAPFTVQALGTDLFVTANETSICRGEHTTLYANQNGWSGNVTYAWSDPTHSTSTTVDVQPDSTTTYTVTATVTSTNGNAGSCTAVGTITIIVNQLPDQVVVSPSATTVCEGEQVTFRANGNAMAYIWYQNGVEIPGENQATLTVNFPTEGAYTFAAKAINVEGCISAVASTPVTVTVNAAPDAVVVSGQTTICNGGHTTLYANVTPNATATYQWFKDGVAITGANGYFLTVDAAGSYKVEATTNGCTTVSDAVVVTVEDTPQIQLTATEETICLGGSTVITAEPTGWNVYNVNHNWNNGYQGSAYTFVPTTAGTFTFSDTASQAISGCAAVGTITITVNPAPATPVLTIDNMVVCEGGRVIVTDTVTRNVNGTPVYTWYRNNIEVPGVTGATLIDDPAVVDNDITTYNYTAIVTYPASGCVSAISAAATVTVNPEPNVVVNMSGNAVNGMICEGGTVTFSAAVMPVSGTYQYQWLLNNVVLPGETNPTLTVTPNAYNDNTYNYSVIVTSAPGCSTEKHAAPLTVVPQPTLTIADANGRDDVSVCEGGSATFYATVVNGVAGMAGYTIAWYNTESTTPLGFGPSYTAIDTVGTYSYYAVVTSPYGCMSQSDHYITYRVVADPVVTIDYEQGADTIICAGGSTTLTAYVTGGIGANSYQWYNGNRAIAGATGQTYTIDPVNDNVALGYHVVVTQEGVDCESTSANFNVNVAAPYTITIANTAGVQSGYYSTCPGGTVTLVANIPNLVPGDVPTYQWYTGNGTPIYGATSSTFTTPTLSLNDRIDYYLVVNSTISGCSFTTNSITVEVLPAPEVEIRGAHTVCASNLNFLNLNAYVTGGVPGAAYTYTWQVRNGSNVTTYPATTSATFTPNLPANDAASIYTITVTIDRTDNTGCTAVSAPFELNVIPAPVVTLTASDATVCAGGNVTFTATVPNGVVYDYVWTINGTVQQNVNANTITVPATGSSMTASVAVSQSGASASCSATANLAVPVQVVAVPTVTIAANHTQMCAGEGANAIISVASVTGGVPGANYTYEWTVNGNALPNAVGNQITTNFATPGVYTYRLVLNGDLGCSSAASAPVTIEVAAQPTVTLTSLSGLNICEGGDVDLTATVTNYGNNIGGVQNSSVYGNMNFNWLRNGITQQNNTNVMTASQSLNQTLNTVDNYTYTVVVTPSGYNCQPATSNDVMISVVNDPTWTDVHVYTADICLGDALRLEANITGGVVDASDNTQGQIVWTYVMSDGTTGTVPGIGGIVQEFTPSAAGSYTFIPTWVGNIGSGCQLTNSASVQQPVTVHELPTAAFTNADNQVVCGDVSGSSVMLEITFTGTAPYTFDIVNMTTGEVLPYHLSSSNVYTFYVSPEATSIYRIENLMDGNACGNAQLGFGAQTTVVVNDIDFEQTMFISGCDKPGEVTFNFNMVSGDPSALAVLTYAHDPANPLYATINNNSVTFSAPTTPGDYPAVLTVQGCDYDVVVRVLVDEYDLGGKFMDQRWDNVAVINNNPNTNGGYTFTSFQWYHNGELIPGAVYSNYEDKEGLNGWYSVEVTGKDSSGNDVTFVTCEVYFSTASHIKVYPVPANVLQEVTIELDLTTEELQGAVLDIYDVTGKLINHITELNPVTKVAGFKAQGTYFGRILTGTNEIKTVKFVIVK